MELSEKFNLPALVIDAKTYKSFQNKGIAKPFEQKAIIILSYHYAVRMEDEIRMVPWDLVTIDEAHKLRNAYRLSNKMGQSIRWATEGRKKLLLTATPFQNSLMELYGLATLIDDHLFGDPNSYRSKYVNAGGNLGELRQRISGICKRTLRKQVLEYVRYTERKALTQHFHPTDDELKLYNAISQYLQKEDLYAIPARQRHLTVLILRKLLASSSQAIAGTLESLHARLIALRDGQKSEADWADEIVEAEEMEEEIIEEGAWMRFRNALCEKGFSFEYSATFGQAVKGRSELIKQYSRCVLFDYSYKYFYGDGYGKDYQILNLDPETQDNYLELYLDACLLAFFQQQRLYREQERAFHPFNVEKPLWIFVGGKVTKKLSTSDASDIVEILKFLARFVNERAASIDSIQRILNQGLVAADGRNLFAGRFNYLNTLGMSAEQIYEDVLSTVFNAPGGGALHIENLKGVTGEIALRVGDNDPFGVINVGDDAKLCKLCEEHKGLVVGELEFSGSLFGDINKPGSTINLLVGSKKFTEGWNSWRVSTMGLMNVGSTEGSQIIQLFGRGVRLKGYWKSLKRSGKIQLPEEVKRPGNIRILETLNIFGIKADYMAQFREFLEEEGLPTNDDRIEFLLPVIRNLGSKQLKIIRLKKSINGVSTEFGDAFKKLGPIPSLQKPDTITDPSTRYLQTNQVVLNWYPKIQAIKSRDATGGGQEDRPNEACLSKLHIAFLDFDALYFELLRYKAERAWHNLNISRENIQDLLLDQSWYRLLIPENELALDSFEKVRLWQEIAEALLKKYCERYYSFRKKEWELPHLEYRYIDEPDPNFPPANDDFEDGYYRILLEESQEEIIEKLKELKELITTGKLKPWEFGGMKAIWFGQHLYEPLLHLSGTAVEISPAALNKGEQTFVDDLRNYYDTDPDLLQGRELYLLRNLSRGRGVGFFEAGNFHPDFIVWVLDEEKQFVSFVDPKGIRNLGATDPKIEFYKTIKDIEDRLGDPEVKLNSFIISNTPSHTMKLLWNLDKSEIEFRNILFQEDDEYIGMMLSKILTVTKAAKI